MDIIQSPEFPDRKPALQFPNWALFLIFFAYALPGNLGHVPWRGDDALHIGVAAAMLREGNWLVPQVAGLPYTEWSPLTYWLGALTGKLTGWLLPLHDAIRLANLAALGTLIWMLRKAARALYGREAATGAALMAFGSLGLLVHAHEMQPQIVLAAACVTTLYGLVKLGERPRSAPFIVAAGTGAAFLTAGLGGLFLTLPLWAVQALLRRRQPACAWHGKALLGASALFLLLLAGWPLALAIAEPGFLAQWWQTELRSLLPVAGDSHRLQNFANLIGWFTWPLWPVALWSLWSRRGRWLDFGHLLPLASAALALALLLSTQSVRPANVLPLLPAMILMASGELGRLRRGAANALDWFGVITFSLLGLAIWVGWLAINFGWPEPVSRNLLRLLHGYAPSWNFTELLVALVLSAGWIVALLRTPFFPLRGAMHWAVGLTLAWGLAASLGADWVDYEKSYARLSTQVARIAREHQASCLATEGAGDAQRAALYYFTDLKLAPRNEAAARDCPLLLVYASGNRELPEAGLTGAPLWQIQRGRGRFAERFALFAHP